MATPNPTPARDAVEAAADEVISAGCELYSKGLGDGHPLGGSYGREYEGLKADLREAVTALITATRADERAQWAARATEQERDAVTAAIDAVWQSRSIADRRAAINALITATRADERAQWAAVKVALTKAFAKGRNMTDDEILAAADEIKERWMQAVHDKAQIVDNRIKALEQGNRNAAFGLADLRYAATYRCQCGVGMAYPLDCWVQGAWYCSSILLGTAEPGTTHDEPKPFVAWAIKSEGQPSARGATTRPTLAAPAVADTPAPQRAKGEG